MVVVLLLWGALCCSSRTGSGLGVLFVGHVDGWGLLGSMLVVDRPTLTGLSVLFGGHVDGAGRALSRSICSLWSSQVGVHESGRAPRRPRGPS